MGDPGVGADLVGVDLAGVGGDVGQAEHLLHPGAGDARARATGRRCPASTTATRATVSTHRGRTSKPSMTSPRHGEHRAGDHRAGWPACGPRRGRPRRPGRPGRRRHRAAAASGRPNSPVSPDQRASIRPADRGVARAHPGHGDGRLGLALGAREHDRAGDQASGDGDRGDAGEQRGALQVEGDGAEGDQQAGRDQRRTTTVGRLPGLEVALDDVGHRLDDVVVDPRRAVVDAGGDGEVPAVLDALHDQAGVVGQRAALGGDDAVAAVDGGGVEQADAAGQLGQQLGDGHGAGQDEVDAAGAGGDGDPHQPRCADWCLGHRSLPVRSGLGLGGSGEGCRCWDAT